MPSEKIIMPVLQHYWRWVRGMTLGAQGMVIDDARRVLLIRHTYRPGWHFPGGGVEKNEPIGTALERELREEAGVAIVGTPELFGVYANFRHFPNDHVAFFLVRTWTQPSVPGANNEIVEQGFFAIDALPEGTHRAVIARVAEVFEGRTRDPMW